MSGARRFLALVSLALAASCGGGGGASTQSFQLVEFLAANRDEVVRNATLTFVFSAPVAANQDLAERLKIRSLDPGTAASARGAWVVVGERVDFLPALPRNADRSDSGLRASCAYGVFLEAGADALRSANGDAIARPVEHVFDTGPYFEDPVPAEPPRATGLFAVDTATGARTDLGRLDADPVALSRRDSASLLAAGRVIEPGAGAAPAYATPWRFELLVSEPLDPATVTRSRVRLLEIRHDALDGAAAAAPGRMGDEVSFPVPIDVDLEQHAGAAGLRTCIVVTPRQTLLDDARYRIVFQGAIHGIDFRKAYAGDNGLTGDDVGGPGGLGYVSEFLVYDRPAVQRDFTIDFAPFDDGVRPETGATTLDPALVNNAAYDDPALPGLAAGVLDAFGDGRDGDLAVAAGQVATLDTGDVANGEVGNPFEVADVDPGDAYPNQGPGSPGTRTLRHAEATEWSFRNLVVSSGATLRIRGVNPARVRVSGTVVVGGTIDAAGGDGLDGASGSGAKIGGAPGPGAGAGGEARAGTKACSVWTGSCATFDSFLAACTPAKVGFPYSRKGEGPGRGSPGGEFYRYYYADGLAGTPGNVSGTGGGGGGHALAGQRGEDRLNAGGAAGSAGPACCSTWNVPNSGVIGQRGTGGSAYGDRMLGRLTGGSGGGAGGSGHQYLWGGPEGSGGSGGGGGGALEILARGAVTVSGTIDVSGGDGGKGALYQVYVTNNYRQTTGGGGGGSGGSLSLISADRIDVTGGALDARGGRGGPRSNDGTGTACGACNAGGDGARGYLLLMDADGRVDGLPAGDDDDHPMGVLTMRPFGAQRFPTIAATTELAFVGAPSPRYEPFSAIDFDPGVAQGQRIRVYASTARPRADDVYAPDLSTESDAVEIARVAWSPAGPVTTVLPGAEQALVPAGDAERRSFLRLRAVFEYERDVEAAAGPFAFLDRAVFHLRFNE